MKSKEMSALEILEKIKAAKNDPNFFDIENRDGEILVTYKYSYPCEPNAYHYRTIDLSQVAA